MKALLPYWMTTVLNGHWVHIITLLLKLATECMLSTKLCVFCMSYLSTYCPNWLMNAAIYSFLFSKLRTTCVTCQTSRTSEYSNFLTVKTSHWRRSGIVNHNSKQMIIWLFGTPLCIDIINRSKGPYGWKLCQAAISGNSLKLYTTTTKMTESICFRKIPKSITLIGTASQQSWEQYVIWCYTKQTKK